MAGNENLTKVILIFVLKDLLRQYQRTHCPNTFFFVLEQSGTIVEFTVEFIVGKLPKRGKYDQFN